jgi:hypothetical protein
VALRPANPENNLGKAGHLLQHRHFQFGPGFRLVLGDAHAQAAEMTLAPGQTEGGPSLIAVSRALKAIGGGQ